MSEHRVIVSTPSITLVGVLASHSEDGKRAIVDIDGTAFSFDAEYIVDISAKNPANLAAYCGRA